MLQRQGQGQGAKDHTICLMQTSRHDSTRFYTDFASISACLEGILRQYETKLKEANPGAKGLQYDQLCLFAWIDDLRELTILTWDASIQGYKRYDRAWLKASLGTKLASLVGR